MITTAKPIPSKLMAAYIAEVQAGGPGIGNYERWMVERHLSDMKHGHERGIEYDADQAHRACMYFQEVLVHTAGQWSGDPFILMPHQAFWISVLEGWRWADTGTRRFRKALIYIARKNGKTQFAAGMACKELMGHHLNFPEPEGEVYCAATNVEEAARTWRAALRMLDASPWISESQLYVTGRDNVKTAGVVSWLGENNTKASLLAKSKKAANSLSPHLVIKDEMHAYTHEHRDMCETLSTGGGVRQQPLELITTTAGSEDSELLEEELRYAEHVVARGAVGDVVDDTVFAAIYRVDEEHKDGWLHRPELWRQANPGLGTTPKKKFIADLVNEATNNPSKRNSVARYHMNITVGSEQQAFPSESWKRGEQCLIIKDGDTCFGGVDLSKSGDFASVALVFPKQIDGKWHYGVRTRSWCCNGVNQVLDFCRPPFSLWIKDGILEHSTDEAIDTSPIKAYIREAFDRWDLQAVNFDQMRTTEMSTELLNFDGINMQDLPQTAQRYEPAVKEFMDALEDRRVYHEGDPCLAWQASNTEWKVDHREYRMPHKLLRKRRKKIDAISAMLMAMAAAIHDLNEATSGNAVIF